MPPLEFCLAVMPSQAANSRPDLKTLGSGTLAAIAEALSFPILLLSKRTRQKGLDETPLGPPAGEGCPSQVACQSAS